MFVFSIDKGKLYKSPNLGVGNKFYSVNLDLSKRLFEMKGGLTWRYLPPDKL
tara:strand:- start:1091 stop:1246 length:156 start_codon:yes stop_codon:yes gene_type:complete